MTEIARLATTAVVTVDPKDTLVHAARRMSERGVGSAIVVADSGLGIITERDLLKALAVETDARTAIVEGYMTANAVALAGSCDVLEAARLMLDGGFRHLIVTDDAGSIAGVLSIRDLFSWLLTQMTQDPPDPSARDGSLTVESLMSSNVLTVAPDDTLDEAARVMTDRSVGSAVVVDPGGLRGIVTERDVLHAVASGLVPWLTYAEDCMTSEPKTVEPSTAASEALSLMRASGFRHLPVIKDGAMVGIVSLRDLLTAPGAAALP